MRIFFQTAAIIAASPIVLAQGEVTAVVPMLPMDNAILYVAPGTSDVGLVFVATTDNPADTAELSFAVDDEYYAVSDAPDARGNFAASVAAVGDIGYGVHRLRIDAMSRSNPGAVIGQTITFNLLATDGNFDQDHNGLPDNPLEILSAPNRYWYSAAVSEETGARQLTAMGRVSAMGGALALEDPADRDKTVVVTMPPTFLYGGEEAIFLVRAASDLVTLYGPVESSIFSVEPGALVTGAQYAEISLLTIFPDSEYLFQVAPDRLAANPLHAVFGGLDFVPGGLPAILGHPTRVQSDPETGLEVIVWESDWLADHVADPLVGGSRIEADITGLSTFAPFETTRDAPAISVWPSPLYPYAFGFVAVEDSKDAVFVVTNTAGPGGGRLVGEARTQPPFSLASEHHYDLGAGESVEIIVRFAPDAPVGYLGNVLFTGGGGASVVLQGIGYVDTEGGSPPSCAGGMTAGGGTHGGRGDLIVLACAGLFLIAAGRNRAACKRQRMIAGG